MMRYVQHLVEGDEPEDVARNVALVYLAVITSFAESGLLQADLAPGLVIDVEGREFEILLDNQADVHDRSGALILVTTPSIKLDPAAGQLVSQDPAQLPKSKAFALLDALEAKHAIGQALATVEGVQVHLEPIITGTQRRNDIRITGSAASGLSSEDIDITIISLASQDSQTATLPLVTTEDDSAAEKTAKTRWKAPQFCGEGETTPAPALGPTIQAFRPLPRRYDGNGRQGCSQALEIDHDGWSLLSPCQAALPRPEGQSPLLRAVSNLDK